MSFLLVEFLILGWLGYFGFFGPLFGGTGSFFRRFTSSSEELGLWLFRSLSWVFFPQRRGSFFLQLFFDSCLLPWAFTWGLGLRSCWGLQSWGGLSLLPMKCVGTRTLNWRLLSCSIFLCLYASCSWSFLHWYQQWDFIFRLVLSFRGGRSPHQSPSGVQGPGLEHHQFWGPVHL